MMMINYHPVDAYHRLTVTSDIVLIDVRTADEHAVERIKGSVCLDFYADDFLNTIESLDREKTYMIYCRTGRRSMLTIQEMQQRNFKSLLHVKGGIVAWKEHNLPTIKE